MGLVNNQQAAPAATQAAPAGPVDVMAMIRAAQGAAPAQTAPAPSQAAPAQTAPAPSQAAPAPAPAQTAPAPAPASGGLALASQCEAGKLYHVGTDGAFGKAVGVMNGQAIFTNAAGAMFMVPSGTPVMAATAQPEMIAPTSAQTAPAPVQGKVMKFVDCDANGNPIVGVNGAGNAINPPDANQPAANLDQKAAIVAATQAAQSAAVGLAAPAQTEAPAAPAQTEAPAAPAAPATEKPRRGRPPGKKNASKAAADVATGEAQTANLSGLILIIDGAVSGPIDMDLDPYVYSLVEAVCATQTPPIPDPRLADPKGPLGYGAWKGALAAAARASVPSGVCTISRSELSEPVIEALIPMATLVIRGSR